MQYSSEFGFSESLIEYFIVCWRKKKKKVEGRKDIDSVLMTLEISLHNFRVYCKLRGILAIFSFFCIFESKRGKKKRKIFSKDTRIWYGKFFNVYTRRFFFNRNLYFLGIMTNVNRIYFAARSDKIEWSVDRKSCENFFFFLQLRAS